MIKFGESGHPVFHESIVPRNAQKQRRWKIVNTLLWRWGWRLKLFFAQLFVLIRSVFTEQSQICVKNVILTMIEQGDLLWQDNLTHCLCRQVHWWKRLHLQPMILRKKIYCKSTKNEWKGYYNKIVWLSFVLMQDSWQRLTSDSISWQKRHWRILTICSASGLSWVHFAKRWKIIWPERLDSREHQNWARIGSRNQLPTR